MERDVIDLLKDLVAIESQNPSLVPGAAGESTIAGYVADWAQAAGLAAEIVEATPGRPSVLVRSGSRSTGSGSTGSGSTGSGSSARSLLLCGHLDTVGTGEMKDPLTPVVDGDRLYGRGGYDMKAGLAAALVACRETARRGLEVIVAAVADEEHSSLGVQEILRHVRADAAIVTEPTELTVATAHRGFVWTEFSVTGVAAHGSRPHLGVDAIMKTGPVLTALADLNERLRERVHPRLGPGFVHAIVQAVARAAAATTGRPAELAGASYWADAAFIAGAGIQGRVLPAGWCWVAVRASPPTSRQTK